MYLILFSQRLPNRKIAFLRPIYQSAGRYISTSMEPFQWKNVYIVNKFQNICHDLCSVCMIYFLSAVIWSIWLLSYGRDFNRKSHDFGVLRYIVEGSAPHKPVRPLLMQWQKKETVTSGVMSLFSWFSIVHQRVLCFSGIWHETHLPV